MNFVTQSQDRALTNHGEEDGLPHLVYVVLLLDLEDDDASLRRILIKEKKKIKIDKYEFTYFPHGHKWISEEVNVDLSRHLRRLLHVHIIVEEVLESGHFTECLELVAIALHLLGCGFLHLGLRSDPGDAFKRLLLLLSVEGSLALIVPELP